MGSSFHTQVFEFERAKIVGDTDTGITVEFPLEPQVVLEYKIEEGHTYYFDRAHTVSTRDPDRIRATRLFVNPQGGDVMYTLFKEDDAGAQPPHEEFCACGDH